MKYPGAVAIWFLAVSITSGQQSTSSAASPSPVGVATSTGAPDSNDPNSAHDAGIYLYDHEGNTARMTLLDPKANENTKSSGGFGSAATIGVMKMKWKATLGGSQAAVATADKNVAFYLYFGESSGRGESSFAGPSSPSEFTLVRFEVHHNERQVQVMKAGTLGNSFGTDEKDRVPVSSVKIRPGVFKVSPNSPLPPGEYCFLYSTGSGSFGTGAGAYKLFDFSIRPDK
jgi:hypothetical protein